MQFFLCSSHTIKKCCNNNKCTVYKPIKIQKHSLYFRTWNWQHLEQIMCILKIKQKQYFQAIWNSYNIFVFPLNSTLFWWFPPPPIFFGWRNLFLCPAVKTDIFKHAVKADWFYYECVKMTSLFVIVILMLYGHECTEFS